MAAVATVVAVAWLARGFARYEVRGASMEPSYRDGDWLVVQQSGRRPPRRGDVVLVSDPREPARTLVKRVAEVGPGGELDVRGDNPNWSTDSRTFGPVAATAVLGRVRFRYWPLRRR